MIRLVNMKIDDPGIANRPGFQPNVPHFSPNSSTVRRTQFAVNRTGAVRVALMITD